MQSMPINLSSITWRIFSLKVILLLLMTVQEIMRCTICKLANSVNIIQPGVFEFLNDFTGTFNLMLVHRSEVALIERLHYHIRRNKNDGKHLGGD